MNCRDNRPVDTCRVAWRRLGLWALLLACGCKPGSSHSPGDALPHLRLAGLVAQGTKRWALLLLAEPGQATQHLKLMAGQKLGPVEVIAIDPGRQSVQVCVGQRQATLTLAEHGLKPDDGYSWLQRLTPEEHTRLYSTSERQKLVNDHARSHEERQRQELARELAERDEAAAAGTP